MTTFTALTTVDGKEAAYALSEAMERMDPEPLGVGVFLSLRMVQSGKGCHDKSLYCFMPP